MNRTSCLAATAGLSLCALAHAQSAVSVYGLIDLSLDHYNNTTAGSVSRIASGQDYGSRLGVRGKEDLGGGLGAIFQLEGGLRPDEGQGTAAGGAFSFNRETYVGLNGSWGRVIAGRVWTPSDDAYSVYRWNNYAAYIYPEFGNFDRFYNNALKYSSPIAAGVQFVGMYSFGETAGSTRSNSASEFGLNYESGPIGIYGAWNTTHTTSPAADRTYSLAGRYELGPVTLRAAYLVGKPAATGIAGAKLTLLGTDYTFTGGASIGGDIQHREVDQSARGSDELRLMANYPLSKSTTLYTILGHLKNKGGDQQSFVGTVAAGASQTEISIGIRHRF